MNIDRLTQKSIAAIQGAQGLAQEYGNPQMDQEHFLLTKATAMCMKKGTYHLPLRFTKVERPCVFFSIGER